MSIDDEIARTKGEIGNLRRQIANKENHICNLVMQKSGLSIGDRIMTERGSKMVEISVNGVDRWGYITGNFIRKDGTVSSVEVCTYNYWTRKEGEE